MISFVFYEIFLIYVMFVKLTWHFWSFADDDKHENHETEEAHGEEQSMKANYKRKNYLWAFCAELIKCIPKKQILLWEIDNLFGN